LALEGVALAGVGALVGVPLAAAALSMMRALDPGDIPRLEEIGLHPPVLLFAVGLTLISGLVVAMLPLVTLRFGRLTDALGRDAGGGAALLGRGTRRQPLRAMMTAGEVALAVVLLLGAGLLGRSFVALVSVDPGFRADGVLTARLAPPTSQYPPGPRRAQLFDQLLQQARAIPGVEQAGLVSALPMSGGQMRVHLEVEGESAGEESINLPEADLRLASAGYLEAMGIPLIEGRFFDERDREGAVRALVISERLAREAFPNGSAIGRRIGEFGEVVGVAGDVHQQALDRDAEGTLYISLAQLSPMMAPLTLRVSIALRGNDVEALAPALRTQVRLVDPSLALEDVRSLASRLSEQLAQPRFFASLLSVFAGIALLLSGLGLYSLQAYSVAQQARETGIRMALGARRGQVVSRTLGHGLRLTLLGLVVGLAAAVLLREALADFLFATSVGDPATYVAVIALLLASSLAACWFPARRAASADPIRSLRHE
jgi:putative ABC transport system permease protein